MQLQAGERANKSFPLRSPSVSLPPSLPADVGRGAYRIFLNQEDKKRERERTERKRESERKRREKEDLSDGRGPSGASHTYAYVLRSTAFTWRLRLGRRDDGRVGHATSFKPGGAHCATFGLCLSRSCGGGGGTRSWIVDRAPFCGGLGR